MEFPMLGDELDIGKHHAVEDSIVIDKASLESLVNKYIMTLETGETDSWCRCLWAVHPDDANIKQGGCRLCNEMLYSTTHDERYEGYHKFMGRRQRRVDTEPTCPVHTKEGMMLHFFEWIKTNGSGA